jgi:hypothetical protein
MMTKKDFKQFANTFAIVEDDEDRETLIRNCEKIFKMNNPRFDEDRFREWVRRVRADESLKGLR